MRMIGPTLIIFLAITAGFMTGIYSERQNSNENLKYISDTYFDIVTKVAGIDNVTKIMQSYEYCEKIMNNSEMTWAVGVLRNETG